MLSMISETYAPYKGSFLWLIKIIISINQFNEALSKQFLKLSLLA